MNIVYNSRHFPMHLGPRLSGRNSISFSDQELFWAAITVGRANVLDVLSNGIHSEYEILYRASIVAANLTLSGNDLVKSSAYQSLDPSEKGAISYFLGLTFCKLLSHKLLDTPWLLHIDVYRNHFQSSGQAFKFGSSRSRPDLIGLDKLRRWVVIESKGRTNTYESNLLIHAKKQTKNLRRIGRNYPNLRVAAVTHFTNGVLTLDWEDPDEISPNGFDLDTSIEDYLTNYYRLIINILNNNETFELGRYTLYSFDNLDLTVGLETNIYNAYTGRAMVAVEERDSTPSVTFQELPSQNFFAGSDGIIVGLGQNWSDLLTTDRK